ncbi:MAG TPA: hypothetical protein VFB02_13730 [Bradyrhizobium sp.]|nr:hypothetical protein [Bradyrhizobium sp.]
MTAATLFLDAPPDQGQRRGPSQPTLLPPLPAGPIAFADLPALCAKIHRLRRHRPIQLSIGVASYQGSETFPIFKLWALNGEDQEYLGTLAVQGIGIEALTAAITAADRPTAAWSAA